MIAALPFRWSGEAMEPAQGFAKRADEAFVIGQTYVLALQEDRSAASHRHYFACVREAWENLPEALAAQFPTPDHLRKRALILTGYRNEREFVASSRAEALRIAAFLRPADEFALVSVSGCSVTEWTARSQNTKAMDKATFAASKDAVLGKLAEVLGVEPDQLGRAA